MYYSFKIMLDLKLGFFDSYGVAGLITTYYQLSLTFFLDYSFTIIFCLDTKDEIHNIMQNYAISFIKLL